MTSKMHQRNVKSFPNSLCLDDGWSMTLSNWDCTPTVYDEITDFLRCYRPNAIGDLDTWNALYWVFQEDGVQKDVNTALQQLKNEGCSLVEKAWVENHWIMILWKLANTVLLWPSSQANRWSFQEVITQLLYRYADFFILWLLLSV
jgi:hypothetical protein